MAHNMNRFVSFLSRSDTWNDPCEAYNQYAMRVKAPTMTRAQASKYTDELSRQFVQEQKLAHETGIRSSWPHYQAIAKLRSFAQMARDRQSRSPVKPRAPPPAVLDFTESSSESDDDEPAVASPPSFNYSESDDEEPSHREVVEEPPTTLKRRFLEPSPEPRAPKRHKPLCAFTEPAIHMLVGVESMLQNADTDNELQRVRVEEAVRRCQEAIAAIERLSDHKDENDLM